MKRLFALLLMLALVPAIASAAIPAQLTNTNADNIKYAPQMGIGSSRLITTGTHDGQPYTAKYYFTGALEYYTYTFACGCEVDFNSKGGIYNNAPVRHDVVGHGMHEWDEATQSWVKYSYSYDPSTDTETVTVVNTVTAEDMGHSYSASTHPAPVTFGIDGRRPPLNAADASASYGTYAELKSAVLAAFPQNLADVTGGEQIPADRMYSSSDSHVLIKKNGMYGYYYKGEFLEAYAGSLVFNTYWEENECRLMGDSGYGADTEGFYDWETGDLSMYKFYTADRMMNAVYTVKNVLVSYEVWDNTNAWWGFFDNEWFYSANGNPDDASPATPTEEVLEMILKAPVPAEYESACVTDESQLSDDEKGVPYILASRDAIQGATVQTEATQLDAHSTEFDISLMKDGSEVDPTQPVTLTLGYPAGMPQDVSKAYDFVVIHTTDDGTEEVMSTMNGALELTANGPQVTANSFSPYKVIWGTAEDLEKWADIPAPDIDSTPDITPTVPDSSSGTAQPGLGSATGDASSLPKTGDDSQLWLFAALLAVSSGALAVICRRRARA